MLKRNVLMGGILFPSPKVRGMGGVFYDWSQVDKYLLWILFGF
jgi:hypothetical protein